jgi:hypothetical protein
MFSTKSVLKINALFVGILCLYLVSCTPEDAKPDLSGSSKYSDGVLVINGGNSTSSGSLSFFNRETNIVENDIFEKANGSTAIGGTLNSVYFRNDTAYIISSDANKIVIAGKTFQKIQTITGLEQPRNMVEDFLNLDLSQKTRRVFVTQWGANGSNGNIKVINTSTGEIASTIKTNKGPDKMLYVNRLLWVINGGGSDKDSTIQQFDLTADTLLKTIQVPLNPKDMVRDANGDIWVLCSSYPDRTESGKLIKLKDDQIQLSFDVPKGADMLVKDKTNSILYFIAENKVWQKDILNFGKTPPSVFGGIKKTFQNLTAIGIDTDTENLYCADAIDSKSNGTVYIFDKTTFAEKSSIKVGIKPIGFIFK